MEKNAIEEAKKIINKSKSMKDKYFKISKEELYKPEEVDFISGVDYERFCKMVKMDDFIDANKAFKDSKKTVVDRMGNLEKMTEVFNAIYNKRSIWEKYTIYRIILLGMRQILKNDVKILEKELEEASKQIKDGNIDALS